MSDVPWATATEVARSRNLTLGFKCWKGMPEKSVILIVTNTRYDDSASYKEEVDVLLRVDKGERRPLLLSPINLNSLLAFRGTVGDGIPVDEIRDEIAGGHNQAAVAIGATAHTVPLRGSRKAMERFDKICDN